MNTSGSAHGRLLNVPEADLEDLRRRLRATRWPREWPAEEWDCGEAYLCPPSKRHFCVTVIVTT